MGRPLGKPMVGILKLTPAEFDRKIAAFNYDAKNPRVTTEALMAAAERGAEDAMAPGKVFVPGLGYYSERK